MHAYQTVDLVERFGAADLVVVTDNMNRPLLRSDDDAELAALLAVLAEIGTGWHVPTDGVPISRVRVNFRHDGEAMGDLGVGRKFLTTHVFGTFLARESSQDLAERLLDTVNAADLLPPPRT